MTTILDVLREHADRAPAQPAVLAPGRPSVSYGELVAAVVGGGERLAAAGISSADRVAIAVPNGPDLAVAFLTTVTTAVSAPLDVAQPRAQFDRDLDALRPRAVIVARGHETAATEAAAAAGVAVVELVTGETAGGGDDPAHEPTRDLDVALLLQTSGTTSRPKLVPLTQANLLHSARSVAATLRLGPDDRCLNVMPLSHIHGLVAGLLAPLVAGGSVVCTPGFRAGEVRAWIEELGPSWYTAVPTIHQAMLDVARQAREAGRPIRWPFRFARSSSAPLPVPVLEELERELGAPVVEAYGMTEAAHQMASNPLPPAVRKPGTVGLPAGAEISVVDEEGRPVAAGSVGAVVIRGPGVTSGYLDGAAANAAAFRDGWFATGDQGSLDEDGYLTITGRLKEIINRGGEKVAPREVDDVLLEHEDVAQAVAFAIPHPRLGEEVAAAVVLRPDAKVTAARLRVFAAERLTGFKVPRRIVVVDDLPRGRTGKIERLTMAERLGLDRGAEPGGPVTPPADDDERQVAELWQEVLGLDELPSVDVDFFDLGGDSLHATELLEKTDTVLGRHVPATIFFTGATVRAMAAALHAPAASPAAVTIVPVQPRGSRPPLFCLLRAGSIVTTRHFAGALGPEQPILGLCLPAMHSAPDAAGSIEEIAASCVETIEATQPEGPCFLFGHSMGGSVLFETAQQLAARGRTIGLLVLADSVHPKLVQREWRRRRSARYRARKLFSRRGPRVVAFRVRRALGHSPPPRRKPRYLPGTDVVLDWSATFDRERRYVPGPAPGPVLVLGTQRYREYAESPDLGWAPVLAAGWEAEEVPGDHDSMIGEPHVHVLAARLQEHLRSAQDRCGVG